MAWLPDEQWVLQQDTREKKITARSARSTRTHCGKSGAVKFPSDFLTKGQIKKMSGPVESYKMNDPMTWGEFKKMPDDLKVRYIKALRIKYNVPNTAIAEMFGISAPVVTTHFKCLGLAEGRGAAQNKHTWDKEGFYAWRAGASASTMEHAEVPVEEDVIESDKIDDERDVIVETEYTPAGEKPMIQLPEGTLIPHRDHTGPGGLAGPIYGSSTPKTLIPMSGEMTFEGRVSDIMRTIEGLLKDGYVHMTVRWESADETTVACYNESR